MASDPTDLTGAGPADGAQAFLDSQTGTTFEIDPVTGLPMAVEAGTGGGMPPVDASSIDPGAVAPEFVDGSTGAVSPFESLGAISGVQETATSGLDGFAEPPGGVAEPAGSSDTSNPVLDPSSNYSEVDTSSDAGGTGGMENAGVEVTSDPAPAMAEPEPEPPPPPEPSAD
jgi:hypothetical protein